MTDSDELCPAAGVSKAQKAAQVAPCSTLAGRRQSQMPLFTPPEVTVSTNDD